MRKWNQQDVEQRLTRLFQGGPIDRLPRKRRDTDLLLALIAAALEEHAYTEVEFNGALKAAIAGFTDPQTVDHVTVRRYLVDCRFYARSADGSVYRRLSPRIDGLLTAAAQAVSPASICRVVADAKASRRAHFDGATAAATPPPSQD